MPKAIRWTPEQYEAKVAGLARSRPLPKVPKYRNRKITTEHGTFDSEKEARRYADLVLLERAGKITRLCRQVPFALVCNGVLIATYVADAVYRDHDVQVVEDTKSEMTRKLPVFRLKMKMMKACHGISVLET